MHTLHMRCAVKKIYDINMTGIKIFKKSLTGAY